MSPAEAIRHPSRILPPGPRGYPLVGILPQVLKNPLETLTSAARRYGGVVYLGSYRPGRRVILISHPGPLKHVLQERHRAYDRGFAGAGLNLVVGNALPMNDEESWLLERRLIQPALHAGGLAQIASVMTDRIATLVEQWRAPAARGEAIDIDVEMTRLTRDIIVRFLFGMDLTIDGGETAALERSIKVIEANASFLAFIAPLPLWAPTPRNRAFRQAIETLNRLIYKAIDGRQRSRMGQGGLVASLLQARDSETGGKMSDQQVRDLAMGLFVAGHETGAKTLTWIWYLLSMHPEVERRLHAEVDETLGGRPPTMEDLPKLVYTSMTLMEAMRLFPPGWLVSRSLRAGEEDEIDGYTIPKKSLLLYSPYVTHRLPELWKNPDAFDPERFTQARIASRPQFVYIPFGGGPHHCMGSSFAMAELSLAVAAIAQRYRLSLAPGTCVEPKPLLTLSPRNGLPMTVRFRDQKEGLTSTRSTRPSGHEVEGRSGCPYLHSSDARSPAESLDPSVSDVSDLPEPRS